jgi:hypothetical protein
MNAMNPLNFYVSNQSIKEASVLLFSHKIREEAAKNMGSDVMMAPEEIEKVKYANRIAGSSVHPDTGEIIPIPMRLSGFVTFNGPILLFCLFGSQTPTFNAFMQFVNQTYNAGLNYGNRNASSNYTTTDLMRGYGGAVIASVGLAYATRRALAP